jgi:shikimate dehydrogenase
MKLFTIFGNPVEHSKSPLMHNFAFKEFNYDAKYTKTKLEDGNDIKDVFTKLDLSGANVTVPFKEIAFNCVDEIVGIAKQIGAINTIIKKDGKLYGYNTDATGFIEAIKEFKDIKKILIIGAGGTAKSLALIFKQQNFDITVINRSENKLKFFQDLELNTFNWENFKIDKYDLVINSTSAGLKDDFLPMDKDILEKILENSKYAVDVIYGKETPFLKLAKEKNLQTKDGKDMLLYQGVLAFDLFTDKQFDIKEITKNLKSGLDS